MKVMITFMLHSLQAFCRLPGKRLTQPNMIGQYVEKLEIEEVQGLSGLKAMRATVLPVPRT